jgi:hypothetical protein
MRAQELTEEEADALYAKQTQMNVSSSDGSEISILSKGQQCLDVTDFC